jgi:hypothetical protein
VLNEIERNLQDAMQVVRNVHFDPRMLPGGGATELAVSTAITKSLDTVEGACSVRVVVAVILCCVAFCGHCDGTAKCQLELSVRRGIYRKYRVVVPVRVFTNRVTLLWCS